MIPWPPYIYMRCGRATESAFKLAVSGALAVFLPSVIFSHTLQYFQCYKMVSTLYGLCFFRGKNSMQFTVDQTLQVSSQSEEAAMLHPAA